MRGLTSSSPPPALVALALAAVALAGAWAPASTAAPGVDDPAASVAHSRRAPASSAPASSAPASSAQDPRAPDPSAPGRLPALDPLGSTLRSPRGLARVPCHPRPLPEALHPSGPLVVRASRELVREAAGPKIGPGGARLAPAAGSRSLRPRDPFTRSWAKGRTSTVGARPDRAPYGHARTPGSVEEWLTPGREPAATQALRAGQPLHRLARTDSVRVSAEPPREGASERARWTSARALEARHRQALFAPAVLPTSPRSPPLAG